MNTLEIILANLIACASVTPNDAGCQAYMMHALSAQGFKHQVLNNPPVSNFFARYGEHGPLLVFAGHTDVVAPGDEAAWQTPPFKLTVRDGMAYGRGVADMKGSLAAMMIATERFIKDYPHFKGSIGFLITSGEEGDLYVLGTPHVMQKLQDQGILIDACLVGEPSSQHTVGDMIKIGRRGSLSGRLHVQGKQGHVAYPHLADNPAHRVIPALNELVSTVFDEGNAAFPPTSFQITSLQTSSQLGNVIPGFMDVWFNIRYSTEHTADDLIAFIEQKLHKYNVRYAIEWIRNGNPFLSIPGKLRTSTLSAIEKVTGTMAEQSTTGGTSDARFIAPYGIEVLELGPVNATIHQVNESTSLSQLNQLSDIYYELCKLFFNV